MPWVSVSKKNCKRNGDVDTTSKIGEKKKKSI